MQVIYDDNIPQQNLTFVSKANKSVFWLGSTKFENFIRQANLS